MHDTDESIRLERLESLVALQDNTIEELNQVIFEQQKQLDRLELQVEKMALRLRQLLHDQEQAGIENTPPPHYA